MPQRHQGDAQMRLSHGILIEALGIGDGQGEGVEVLEVGQILFCQRCQLDVGGQRA